MPKLLLTVALTAATGLIAATPALAETINVTTTDDTTQCDSGGCSLRGAFQYAQSIGDGVHTNTIVVPAGTYTVATPLQTGSTQLMSVVGAGANVTTIRGDGSNRVAQVGGESTLELHDVTISGGTSPDSDASGGNLTVSFGQLVLDHARVTGGSSLFGGGGIYAQGSSVTVDHSLIDGNSGGGGDGGGIRSVGGGSLTASDSTFTRNSGSAGGAIATREFTDGASLTRVTIAGNTALTKGGGIDAASSTAPIVQGSIIANNTADDCGSVTPVDAGGNVESGMSCGFSGRSSLQSTDPGLASTLVNDGGQLPVLPIGALSPARDLAGICTGTDQRDAVRPQGLACDSGAYEYVQPPDPVDPTPTATPTATAPPAQTPAPTAVPTATPAPVTNKSVAAEVQGPALIKDPKTKKFVPLGDGIVPNGSEIDVRKAEITIKTATPGEEAVFYDGIFKISQTGKITTVTLSEPLTGCPKAKKSTASAAAAKPKTRKLWGSGKGKFRTKGQYSAATIRGTKWLVEDGCRYTKTTVSTGVVSVHDDVKDNTVIVRPGKPYTARPKP